MIEGLVQHDHPLTVQGILRRARTVNGAHEVVTLREPGRVDRATFAEVGDRVDRLCSALSKLGVGDGDRVGTFMWNSQEHLEVYIGAPCMGAVLHTVNLRLFPEHLTYIINHAEDKVVVIDDSLIGLIEPVLDTLTTVEHWIVVGDGPTGKIPNPIRYDDLIASGDAHFDYPELDDRQAAGLCYTSGTTGNPKGVLYSHKSQWIHTLAICLPDAMDFRAGDKLLPIVPMFHANAWGLPYAALMIGADIVMPSRFLQAEPIAQLVESEQITVAAAVPTIWMDLLRWSDEHKPDLSSLRIVPCGGAAVPRSLMQGFEERHGVVIVQAWGMTELSPLGAVAKEPPGVEGEERWGYKTRAGRICAGVDARIIGEDGTEQPWDGVTTGELQVQGPWIASAYYGVDAADKFQDGWLKTGDVCAIDAAGYIRITDRSKDVIKSGGEWISSVDLENELMGHPAIREAAVIAKPDERWTERPLACVVLEEGAEAPAEELAAYLGERVARFWIPDEYAYIEEVPKTSVGKFDKKVLRARLEDGELTDRQKTGAPAPSTASKSS